MSVDDTLREAFGEQTWEVETGPALHRVHARDRRARTWKGSALAGVAAVALLVGAGTQLGHGHPTGDEPVGPPGVSDPTTSPPPSHPTGPSAIDGTWTVGPVTAAQIRSTLREAGQGRWYRTVVRDQPKLPLTYRMRIRDGRVDVVVTGADGRHVPADQEYVRLSGRRVQLEPLAGIGVNRYRWALVDGKLRLTFVSTSEGQDGMTPAAAFQRALYTVANWTRTAPAG